MQKISSYFHCSIIREKSWSPVWSFYSILVLSEWHLAVMILCRSSSSNSIQQNQLLLVESLSDWPSQFYPLIKPRPGGSERVRSFVMWSKPSVASVDVGMTDMSVVLLINYCDSHNQRQSSRWHFLSLSIPRERETKVGSLGYRVIRLG